MKRVKEVSRLTGVSVRTLHYYDQIGLLKPTELSVSGYRLYDDKALQRLQEILLFRELALPLKQISALLTGNAAAKREVLTAHLHILSLRQERLAQFIQLTEAMIKGEANMDFTAFHQEDLLALEAEARQKWGTTLAFEAFSSQVTPAELTDKSAHLMVLLKAFAPLMTLDVTDAQVRRQVQALQAGISQHFYPCNDELLAGLGQLYVSDPRFTATIDGQDSPGLSHFISQAIAAYVES